MANIVASGQITLVDLNDAKSLSAYINSNQPKIQIYNPDNGSYTPNWASSPYVVLTPELYVSGTASNIINQAKSIVWYEAGNATPIANGNGYAIGASNPKALTINQNKLTSRNQITFIAEITWTDPDVNADIVVKAEIEFAKVSSGAKGDTGSQGIQGPKGDAGIQYYTWIKFADNASGLNMSDSPTGKSYMGIAVNKTSPTESNTATDYTWTKVEGDQGAQGIQGDPGADGQPTYTWVKYADNASGGGMSDTPSGKDYIGLAYNKSTQTESSTAGDYTWSLIKGADGQNSVMAYVWTPNGNIIKNSVGTLTAQCDVYNGTTKVTSGVTYKWYKLVSGSWTQLTSTTNYGTTGYTTATLTIPASAIESTSSFKCVATYGGKNYEDVATVVDQTDPIQAVLIAAEGTVFKNGVGTKNVTAKLYQAGSEVDSGGTTYDYKWYMRNAAGTVDPDFGGTGINFKTGKTISVPASQVTNIGNLVIEVWTKS